MKFAILAGALCAAALSHGSAAQASQPVFYFAQDWCPTDRELAEISKDHDVTMSGCCIFKAERKAGTTSENSSLKNYASRLSVDQDLNQCLVFTEVDRANAAATEKRMALLEAQRAEEDRRAFPAHLRSLNLIDLCVEAGRLLRGGRPHAAPAMTATAGSSLVRAELRRRGVSLQERMAKDGEFTLGSSECTMFAANGYPDSSNRTVNSRGTFVQHVFGQGTYVYTSNGRVTSWQD